MSKLSIDNDFEIYFSIFASFVATQKVFDVKKQHMPYNVNIHTLQTIFYRVTMQLRALSELGSCRKKLSRLL